jgi:Uma2 family endonuclease
MTTVMAVEPQPRRFTVSDYYRMADVGILHPDDRVELIEGKVVEMAPIGSRHATCVDRLTSILSRLAGQRAVVRVQGPVRLDDLNEPLPDVALLKPRDYSEAHPHPEDVFLIIEVADTTVRYDRGTKVPLYARAGIPKVWLVDLEQGVVECHTSPSLAGYEETRRVGAEEVLRSGAPSGVSVRFEEIFGA